MVVFEVIIHVSAWTVTEVASANWQGVLYKLQTDPFIQYGASSALAMVLLLFISPSVVRHAFYETFLVTHVVFVAVAFAGIWIHCDIAHLPQLSYIQMVVAFWFIERALRFARTAWYNCPRRGRQWTKATIEPLPGETCRVTLHLPTSLDIKPGSHAYLRFSLRPWESHPFSIAWTEEKPIDPCLPSNEKPKHVDSTTDLTFIIRAKTGLTRHLYTRALSSPGKSISAAFEGPYGGHHSLDSYGHCVLFAGSSGITYQLPFLRQLLTASTIPARAVATRRLTLIWIIRDFDQLSWIQPFLDHLLTLPADPRRLLLTIKIIATRPKTMAFIRNRSTSGAGPAALDPRISSFAGRPNIRLLLWQEVATQVGAMAVTVCGPGGLADDVREGVREVQEFGVVDFVEESFTW